MTQSRSQRDELAITPLSPLWDMAENRDRYESTEPSERADPIENAERNEPIEPIEQADPTEPIDRIEPLHPIDRSESSDHNDHRDVIDFAATMTPSSRTRGRGTGEPGARRG